MKARSHSLTIGMLAASFMLASALPAFAADDPLPSWNDTAPKQAIMAFVGKVTQEGSPDFVPVPERIAVFDNDGTLWAEKPVPFLVSVNGAAPDHRDRW